MIPYRIPFNKPGISGNELEYIRQAVENGHLSGNGPFTKQCHSFFRERYGFKDCFLTTSCTDALEMAAILIDIQDGDEVIVPSFSFVSTALAFERQGAEIRFVDSGSDHPGIDEDQIEVLINERTRAIVPVHYAGIACDMDKIMELAGKYNLYVVEDNALGIESFYKGRPLGSIGHLSCFSFHETKNIHCGEGGMLAINDSRFRDRAEIIWEKGTNRAQFFRGEASFYEWKDTGSSFLPSEMNAAFLYAQLEKINNIQNNRLRIWHQYNNGFKRLITGEHARLALFPDYSTINASSFFLICKNREVRDRLISYLHGNGIMALSHYLPLQRSEYYLKRYEGEILKRSDNYSSVIVRFPIYQDLDEDQVEEIVKKTCKFLCNC